MVRKMYAKGTSKLEGLCFWLLVGVVFVVSSIFIAVFVPLALLGNLLKPLGR
jgi:preprotein translocase subunit SecF